MIITTDINLVRKLATMMLMEQCKRQHIEKMKIEKWEHGEPIEIIVSDYSDIVKYEDGTVYKYDNVDCGTEEMLIELII